MQFNVAQLLKEPTGSIRRYELVEEIGSLDPELELLGPLVGAVQLMRIHSGILVKANLSTAVRVTCNRCLEPIVFPVRFLFEESFRPLTEVHTGRYIQPEEFEGTTEELEDEALLIDEHHILDITEVVRQNIWLALPMYPGCNWAGAGECPNWVAYQREVQETQDAEADGAERAAEETIDPRWAALLNLRDRAEDEEG
jgi:uncharacterized protein